MYRHDLYKSVQILFHDQFTSQSAPDILVVEEDDHSQDDDKVAGTVEEQVLLDPGKVQVVPEVLHEVLLHNIAAAAWRTGGCTELHAACRRSTAADTLHTLLGPWRLLGEGGDLLQTGGDLLGVQSYPLGSLRGPSPFKRSGCFSVF